MADFVSLQLKPVSITKGSQVKHLLVQVRPRVNLSRLPKISWVLRV